MAVDFGFVTEFAKVQVLQVLVDDALAGDYASKVENDPDNHTLYLFNDTIAGDGGDDTIIGDDAIIAAAIADGVKFHDYGKNWVTGVDEYVRKAADYAVKDQAEVRRHELEAHVEVHHTNYDWSHEPSHSGIDKIPYSYGFDVIAGNDAIDGGDGDDLIIGDFGALVLPVVQTSPTTKKEVGELQRDVKYLIKDIEKVLDERYHLHREAAKHEHFFHRFGSHSHSHDDRYRDHSDIVLEIGNDVIQAGDGDDVVLGDNGLAGAVFAADTVGGPMDVDTHDWHLKHLIDEKASESLHRYDSHGWGDEFDEEIFGNDLIAGGAGDDLLYGQIGDDEMTGDAGDDYLRGGKGKNEVDGGAGKGKAEKGGSNLPQHDEQDEIDTMLLSTLNPVLSGALLDLSATDSRPTDSGTTDDGGDSTDDDSGTTDDDDDDDDDDKKKKKGKDKG